MLAAQVFLSGIFLVLVIVQTSILGAPVIKSSSRSTLFAVSAEDRWETEQRGDCGEKVANKVAGKLQRRHNLWHLATGDDRKDEPISDRDSLDMTPLTEPRNADFSTLS